MASYPYFLQLDVTIAAAGGLATLAYNVPVRQTLTLNGLVWAATSAWGFYNIRNANGRQFTNGGQATPVPSTSFQNGGSPNIGLLNWPYKLDIVGGDTIYFDIINGAGAANTIQLTFFGSIDVGSA